MKRQSYSKRILKLLGTKSAVPISELSDIVSTNGKLAAFKRSFDGLADAGLIERHDSGRQAYARLTKEGKRKAHSLNLDNESSLTTLNWDGKWRIILLDLPEERKSERDALRYLLKKAGFICLKNAVWISPLPYEHLFGNIKKDLGLSTELMIFVTDTIDKETEEEFSRLVK